MPRSLNFCEKLRDPPLEAFALSTVTSDLKVPYYNFFINFTQLKKLLFIHMNNPFPKLVSNLKCIFPPWLHKNFFPRKNSTKEIMICVLNIPRFFKCFENVICLQKWFSTTFSVYRFIFYVSCTRLWRDL